MSDKQLQSAAADYDTNPHAAKVGVVYALWLMLLTLLIVTGLTGWKFYQRQQADQALLAQLQTQQQQTIKSNQEQWLALQQQLLQLQQAHTDTANQLAILQDRERNSREDWLALEAEHLIKLATQQVAIEHDVPIAIKALQAADDRLRRSPHPAIVAVRKAIAEDLQALRGVPTVDSIGISLTLSTLTEDVAHLPLNIPAPKSNASVIPAAPASRHVESWSQLPKAIWEDLKSLVVIRNHEEPVKALLAPEQRFFLTENLRLQLEQARLAMLNDEAAVYQERLKTAIGWLEQYFDKNAKTTSAALQTLKQLQQQDIAPTLPDLSRSYKAIQRYADLQDKSVNTVKSVKGGNTAP